MGIQGLPPRSVCDKKHLAEWLAHGKLQEFWLMAMRQGVAIATVMVVLAIVVLSHPVGKTDRDGITTPL